MSTSAATATSPQTRTALRTLAIAGALGILGDLLFRNSDGPALNLFLWLTAAVAVAAILGARAGRLGQGGRWLLIAIGFASCLAIRNAEFLLVLDVMAMLLALALPYVAHRAPLARTTLRDYVLRLIEMGLTLIPGPVLLMARDISWSELKSGPKRAGQIAAGVLLALGIAAVFGGLFASADPVFGALRDWLVEWDVMTLASHVMLAGFIGWVAAGLLRSWLWPAEAPWLPTPFASLAPNAAAPESSRALPVTMAVGTMLLTFTLFVGLQARWLFGGSALVQSVTGLSYAEYARTGFFQMVAASGLALPVMFGGEFLLEGDARAIARLRVMSRVQLLLMGVVMASALYRMALYMTMYGLTQDRILCVAIIAWLTAVSSWFAFTVLRGRRERFTLGAITSGFAVLAALNAVNPDALIARVNTNRMTAGRQFDYPYLSRLSSDAAPVLAERLGSLPLEARCHVARALQRYDAPIDWRSWNRSRAEARVAARASARYLEGCPLEVKPAAGAS